MRKVKAAPVPAASTPAPHPAHRPGGTDRSIAQLAAATHRLTQRRVRDLLPGKIETGRLVLRAPIRGDVPELVRLGDNPAIAAKLASLPSPYTRADAIGFVEIFAQRPDGRPYAITLDDRFIGVIGFTYHAERPPELGYWLGEPFWGQGYMTEAGKALIEAAQATHHYDRVAARALADNAGSLRVLEKLGFVRVGTGEAVMGPAAGQPLVLLELERPRWM